MRLRVIFTAAAAAAAVTACSPAADEPADAPGGPAEPVAAETSVFEDDFNVIGTEPFWAIDIRGATLKMQRPDYQTVEVPHDGPVIAGGSATWSSGGMSVTLTPGACSDGMSDRVYPYEAQVTVDGEALNGCAARPADDLGPPP